MTIASMLSDLWRGGGGASSLLPPQPPKAQELKKSPGGIGLIPAICYVVYIYLLIIVLQDHCKNHIYIRAK